MYLGIIQTVGEKISFWFWQFQTRSYTEAQESKTLSEKLPKILPGPKDMGAMQYLQVLLL